MLQFVRQYSRTSSPSRRTSPGADNFAGGSPTAQVEYTKDIFSTWSAGCSLLIDGVFFQIDLQIVQVNKVIMHTIWDRIVSENDEHGKKHFDVAVECAKVSDGRKYEELKYIVRQAVEGKYMRVLWTRFMRMCYNGQIPTRISKSQNMDETVPWKKRRR